MSEKPSQLTVEPDILTGDDDEENQTVGAMTSDPHTSETSEQAKSDKKGGGMKTYVIAGVICLAVAGGGVFAYKSATGSKSVAKAKPVKKAEEPKAELPETPKAPVAPENNGFPTDNVSKEGQVAADFLKRDEAAPVAQLPVIAEAVNEVAPVAPVAPVEPVAVAPVEPVVVAPVAVVEPTQVVAPVAPVAPVAVVTPAIPVVAAVEPPAVVKDTSINSAFDSIATRVDQVSTRVDGLEKFKSAQEDLNNQIEKRIVRLEGFHDGSGNGSGNSTVKKNHNASGTVAPKPKAVVAKKVVRHSNPKTSIDGDLLVDKSNAKNSAPVREATPVVSLEIHSIYDGRVWVKKPDGSLATFTEGETLPTGEKIKSIDHDKFQVVTNKRVIKKN